MERAQGITALFDNTADGVWVSGRGGRILYWNRAAEAILGYPAQQVSGESCHRIFCGRDGNGNRICGSPCPIRSLLHGGDLVEHFDMATSKKTGEPIWIDISCIAIPSADGRQPAIIHLFRDVTASHQIELLVRQQLAQVQPAGGERPAIRHSELTRREIQIVNLLRTGASTAAIADKLYISKATVRNHVQNIFAKLKVHTRLQAVARVAEPAPQEADEPAASGRRPKSGRPTE